MQIWCVDLDGTIDTFTDQMRALMSGLRAQGDRVVVLSATGNEPTPTRARIEEAMGRLEALGCGDCYDAFVLVGSGPEGVVDEDIAAANKVAYMQSVGAAALIDDKKTNVQAARKAGFLAMRIG